MFSFAIDYYIAVSVAAVGAIQIGASFGQLRGLLLFRARLVALLLGLTLAVAAAVWFFTSTSRNINDFEGGLDANEQAVILLLGTLSGLAFSLLASSLVNARMRAADLAPGEGLDANEQAVILLLGTLSGLAFSLLASSLVNARMRAADLAPGEGLDALRHSSYARATIGSLRYWSREWRTQIKSYLVG